MTYSRRNSVEEQQEASQRAEHIATLCEELHFALDRIDWQQRGLQAPVIVNGVEISSLLDLGQRESNDLLRLVQIKLLERAALETIGAQSGQKALMWSPITVVQPQAFLSLWIITLETDERIPIAERMCDGQRTYEAYLFNAENEHQLGTLFGALYKESTYHLGDVVTIKEHTRLYTGVVIYSIPPDKSIPSRKYITKGFPASMGAAAGNSDMGTGYLVDCDDGFPHLIRQSQIVQEPVAR